MESVHSLLADGVEFIENMPAVFDKKNTEVEQLKKDHSAEKEDLINQIGQLTVDLTWLKKKTGASLRNSKKKELIEFENPKITVKHQCKLLGLPRSSAYYKSHGVTEPSQEEVDIKNAIDKIHYDECSYGCRRMQKELRKKGFHGIGKRRVRRYMDEMGIVAFNPGPNLSKRDLQDQTYPYLLRNVPITHVNHVWGIDITYCGTPRGFIYLVAIFDWYSRLIVGWAISNTMQSDFVIRASKRPSLPLSELVLPN